MVDKSLAANFADMQGVDITNGLHLISDIIRESLNVDMCVLMGANVANEVASDHFCETTIGILASTSVPLRVHSALT